MRAPCWSTTAAPLTPAALMRSSAMMVGLRACVVDMNGEVRAGNRPVLDERWALVDLMRPGAMMWAQS